MMTDLLTQSCAEITAEDTPLTPSMVRRQLAHLDDWLLQEDNTGFRLTKTFFFDDYESGLHFTYELGKKACDLGHRPVMQLASNQVYVTCWTPEIEGLHHNDFIVAAHADAIYEHNSSGRGQQNVVDEALEQSFPASDPPAH